MTCSSCVSKVQKTLSDIKGVEKVNVTLNPQQAEITMHNHIETDEMNSALGKIGDYKIEDQSSMIHETNISKKPRKYLN